MAKLSKEYIDYITSDAWRDRRRRYFARHARRCTFCGATENIQLHHKTYARLGNERDGDLMPLCARCHWWVTVITRAWRWVRRAILRL